MSRVGVWINNYENGAHLRHCLDSILGQTFQDFTIYFFDNHSPSGEPQAIIQDYAAKDERIVVPEIPKGLAGIQHMKLAWDFLYGPAHEYTITLGGHDYWNSAHFLHQMVETMDANPGAAICYPQTWQVDNDNKVVGGYPNFWQYVQPSSLLAPQVLVATVDSMQLFGLWRETVRRKVPVRHCCAGWDHLIVTEAGLHGAVLFDARCHLMMRIQGSSGVRGMESYGEVHLSKAKLAQGQQDFIDQLEWLHHCVRTACQALPPEQREANRNLLAAAIVFNYLVLRGYNLGAVPGAQAQFMQNPLLQELMKGAHHSARMLDQLIKTSKPSQS